MDIYMRTILAVTTMLCAVGGVSEKTRAAEALTNPSEIPMGPQNQDSTQQPGVGSLGNQEVPVTSKDVQVVQNKLNEKGYGVGKVDGVLGAKTIQAIKHFQKDQHQDSTGLLDQRTMITLGVRVGAKG